MSLYNQLFDKCRFAGMLLMILDLNKDDVPRFRDCFLDEEHNIVIHTRTGGGNREEYKDANQKLREIAGYLEDTDDSYDSTYANFRYRVSEEYKELVEYIATREGAILNPAKRWQDTFAIVQQEGESPEKRAILTKMKPVMDAILAGLNQPPPDEDGTPVRIEV